MLCFILSDGAGQVGEQLQQSVSVCLQRENARAVLRRFLEPGVHNAACAAMAAP